MKKKNQTVTQKQTKQTKSAPKRADKPCKKDTATKKTSGKQAVVKNKTAATKASAVLKKNVPATKPKQVQKSDKTKSAPKSTTKTPSAPQKSASKAVQTKRTGCCIKGAGSSDATKVYKTLPKGWRVLKGTLTQPAGMVWIDNGKSLISKDKNGKRDYKHALLINDEKLFVTRMAEDRISTKKYQLSMDQKTEAKINTAIKRIRKENDLSQKLHAGKTASVKQNSATKAVSTKKTKQKVGKTVPNTTNKQNATLVTVTIKTLPDSKGGHPHIIVDNLQNNHVSVGVTHSPKKGKNNPNIPLEVNPTGGKEQAYIRRQGTVAPKQKYTGERKGVMTEKDKAKADKIGAKAKTKHNTKK